MEMTGIMPTAKEETDTQQTEDTQIRRLDHKEIHGQMWQTEIGITICRGELDTTEKGG